MTTQGKKRRQLTGCCPRLVCPKGCWLLYPCTPLPVGHTTLPTCCLFCLQPSSIGTGCPTTTFHSITTSPGRSKKRVWSPTCTVAKKTFSFKTRSFVTLYYGPSLTFEPLQWESLIVMSSLSKCRVLSIKKILCTGVPSIGSDSYAV